MTNAASSMPRRGPSLSRSTNAAIPPTFRTEPAGSDPPSRGGAEAGAGARGAGPRSPPQVLRDVHLVGLQVPLVAVHRAGLGGVDPHVLPVLHLQQRIARGD